MKRHTYIIGNLIKKSTSFYSPCPVRVFLIFTVNQLSQTLPLSLQDYFPGDWISFPGGIQFSLKLRSRYHHSTSSFLGAGQGGGGSKSPFWTLKIKKSYCGSFSKISNSINLNILITSISTHEQHIDRVKTIKQT